MEYHRIAPVLNLAAPLDLTREGAERINIMIRKHQKIAVKTKKALQDMTVEIESAVIKQLDAQYREKVSKISGRVIVILGNIASATVLLCTPLSIGVASAVDVVTGMIGYSLVAAGVAYGYYIEKKQEKKYKEIFARLETLVNEYTESWSKLLESLGYDAKDTNILPSIMEDRLIDIQKRLREIREEEVGEWSKAYVSITGFFCELTKKSGQAILVVEKMQEVSEQVKQALYAHLLSRPIIETVKDLGAQILRQKENLGQIATGVAELGSNAVAILLENVRISSLIHGVNIVSTLVHGFFLLYRDVPELAAVREKKDRWEGNKEGDRVKVLADSKEYNLLREEIIKIMDMIV